MILIIGEYFTGMFILFVYCYCGSKSTEFFENMADALYEAIWPDLQIQLQKYFIVMIANMQTPIHYHGLNVCYLNLETFVAVRLKSMKIIETI